MSGSHDASHLAMKPCPGCGVMLLTLKDAIPGHCMSCQAKPACVLCGSRDALATRCDACDEKMFAARECANCGCSCHVENERLHDVAEAAALLVDAFGPQPMIDVRLRYLFDGLRNAVEVNRGR